MGNAVCAPQLDRREAVRLAYSAAARDPDAEHPFPARRAIFGELARVVRPGGRVYAAEDPQPSRAGRSGPRSPLTEEGPESDQLGCLVLSPLDRLDSTRRRGS